ncbi:glycosyltransferase [Actinoplanes sp. NBRC 101535]|uniref:glycosyltransferase n=1 Tax=Actinoplanes sp. NBRC 101535 TaxID=3032196 RepID=UPI0024A48AB8|nr:glycosyltransferase [Actinoplanes sp. NBRC 101535]GLY06546.1 glycosyl transferase family 1 [Actinoplanes sp. NBRC 101535]
MKVLILTMGTRGDVQPYIALAQELHRRRHDVVLGAPERFADLITEHGVAFAGMDDGPLRVLDTSATVGEVAAGGLRAKAALMRRMPAMFARVFEDCWQIASTGPGADADLIVHNGQIMTGRHVAEKLGVPAVLALPIPLYVPTREFAWPGQQLPSWLPTAANRASYAGMKAPALMFGRTVDRWRAGLGLPRRRGRHDPLRTSGGGRSLVLHAVSPQVVPRPADWPVSAQVTGYWFADRRTTVTETLPVRPATADGGDPLVFVGFGSMAGPDPAAVTREVVAALRMAGVRGILAAGWGGLSEVPSPPDVFLTGEVPHETLFPQVAAVVHHGGAGTTAAAVRAGVPQVVCPFVADQPFWGRRMHQLGVAPEPIAQRSLTVTTLAAAIRRAVGDPDMIGAARRLGERVRAENGVAVAVDLLERAVAERR